MAFLFERKPSRSILIAINLIAAVATFTLIRSYRAWANEGQWQCTTSSGTYSKFELPKIGAVREISGEMMFSKLEYDPKWKPNAAILFDDGVVDPDCDCVGIKVFGYEKYPDILGVYLQHHGKLEELGSVPYDKPVTFKLSYSRDSKLKLEVGSGVVVTHYDALSTSLVNLSCSGATVTFRNILAKADLGLETNLTTPRETIDR
jgi:hypothetical protein